MSLADPRERYLTEEQLCRLAVEHGRELPPLDQENVPELPAAALAIVEQRLTALEERMEERFDQLAACVQAEVAALQRTLATLQQQIAACEGSKPNRQQ